MISDWITQSQNQNPFFSCLANMISQNRTRKARTTAAFFLGILIFVAFITQWIDVSIIKRSLQKKFLQDSSPHVYQTEFDCSLKCSEISVPVAENISTSSTESCPEYFRWIHEDLRPWKVTGITEKMVEKAKEVAHIRIIILNGRVYMEKYKEVFQTRDVITIWGILQLLRLYPGRLPDLDLMFECNDRPVIKKRNYIKRPNAFIPPLFHYCSDDLSFDIVFPDWSFWGWPEVNIRPWEILKEDLKVGNKNIEWMDREPYAYWKGNIRLGAARRDLLKCNATDEQDWKARIFNLEWGQEKKQKFSGADLASQCTYRYKIYVEGVSWSVSEKYILACDSMSLIISPQYYDFFTRSLLPTVHYWPINKNNKCGSIKFAVEWGNKYTDKAQEIGKSGSDYVQENLKMKYVYDYIFHLLNEYSKLMKYKPSVPEGAVEVCSETFFCSVRGLRRRFRKESMVTSAADSRPCTLPPSFDPTELRALRDRKGNLEKQAVLLEQNERSGII
ncbi:uncharacterized protein [Primulina huaijiensis]|uniref:uncharacterized protein n=1 Tax=Primulina huaijiensis TaxID=1492673 RepID=UPI003CC6FC06